MRKLTYSDIANLPQSHPDYVRFMKEINDLDDAYEESDYSGSSVYSDEDSLPYFNRFIAGDR